MTTFKRLISIGTLYAAVGATPLLADTCVSDPTSTTTVCAGWSQPNDPEHNFDFSVLFSPDPLRPTVRILASDTWRLYTVDASVPSGIGDLGDVIIDQAIGNPPVELLLAKPDGSPAAHNLTSIREVSPAGHYVNIIPGSHITGSVLGTIDIRRVNPVPGSGQLHLIVDGDIQNNVNAYTVRHLQIGGSLIGHLICDEIKPANDDTDFGVIIGGDLEGAIDANVLNHSSSMLAGINIAGDIDPGASINIVQFAGICFTSRPPIISVGGNAHGEIFLGNGVPCPSYKILIEGMLTAPGAIKLNNQVMAGSIEIRGGGSGNLVELGVLLRVSSVPGSGQLYLGNTPGSEFSGKVTIGFITCPSGNCAQVSAQKFSGEIVVSSAHLGKIDVQTVLPRGRIQLDGNFDGQVAILTALEGDVVVGGKFRENAVIRAQSMRGKARVLVNKLLEGGIVIDQDTAMLSMIDVTDGIAQTGYIRVNEQRANYNHNGTIHIGKIPGVPMPDVRFDGSIRLSRSAFGDGSQGGNLNGRIEVIGCHATNQPLDICPCGTAGTGKIALIQDGCPLRVASACLSGCN